jgi:hypothetical protein
MSRSVFCEAGWRAVNLRGDILKCVAFIGIKKDGRFQPRATAFVIRYKEDQHDFDHLVTAEHVIAGLLSRGYDIWLRFNIKNGDGVEVRLDDPSRFRFHPNNDQEPTDVAVSPFDARAFQDEQTGEYLIADMVPLVFEEGEQGFLPTDEFARLRLSDYFAVTMGKIEMFPLWGLETSRRCLENQCLRAIPDISAPIWWRRGQSRV